MNKYDKEARQLLDKMVRIFNSPCRESAQKNAAVALWNIVTALRGPDVSDFDCNLKDVTTARIRRDIGMKKYGAFGAFVADDDNLPTNVNAAMGHFGKHVAFAVEAIRTLYPPKKKKQ